MGKGKGCLRLWKSPGRDLGAAVNGKKNACFTGSVEPIVGGRWEKRRWNAANLKKREITVWYKTNIVIYFLHLKEIELTWIIADPKLCRRSDKIWENPLGILDNDELSRNFGGRFKILKHLQKAFVMRTKLAVSSPGQGRQPRYPTDGRR